MSTFRAAQPRKPGGGVALPSSEVITARLEDLERKVERLRALYESFFLGVERRPPHVPRQELNRLMLETQQLPIRNAALRFRFQALSQRWTLLTTYWNRTLREIESGTYRRDLQKAYRRIAARGEPLTENEAATLGIPLGRAKAFVAQQNRRWSAAGSPAAEAAPDSRDEGDAPGAVAQQLPAPPVDPLAPLAPAEAVVRAPRGRPAVSPPRPDDDGADLVALQRDYAEAHSRLALSGAPPSVEQLRAKVLPHLQRLRAGNPAARLDLTVAAKDGRVVIRAKPVG